MNVNAQNFRAKIGRCVNRWHGATIGRHSLSQPFGLPAPSEREPGWAVPFTPPPRNRNVAGDFHRPYGTQKILHFTVHRGTLPQSRPLGVTAPSEREPGMGCAIQPGGRGLRRCGRFSSPLRKGGCHSSQHSETPTLRAIFIAPTEGRVPFIGEKRGRCGCTDPAGCVREG